jgi:phenylpropionate dioxygenase-like ring-hydroxylating dioxygenase large terminal subunit
MGSLRMHTFPNFWIHILSDHAVSARLLPLSVNKTLVTVSWLVHKNAEEGKDYDLDRMKLYWQRTAEQDWDLCCWTQKGVELSKFQPGPYSKEKESGVNYFVDWYIKQMKK